MRPRFPIAAGALVLILAGCGEQDQIMSADNTDRGDTPAWQGAKNPFVAQGWNPGSKESWETQLRTRGQRQNEYVRTE